MSVVVIELLLWGGLIFFLWVLKDTMGKLESDIERSPTARKTAPKNAHQLVRTRVQRFSDPIGSYRDAPIYRHLVIDGRTYCFEHICACTADTRLEPHQRCVEPGLLYSECAPEKSGDS
jgi:hypothetical protein